MAGGAATERIIREEGDRPLVPGSPLSIAMVTGDFDLSGIGTVTHVEGNRVYGFGHPMLSLGACEFPMMTGYIHTVYPRASVSMKMGSPLKVVGVIDTDVSTSVAGRIGAKPDMLPLCREGQDQPVCRRADVSRANRPRADAPVVARHGGAHQRDRHRGKPARGADGPVERDHPLEGAEPITVSDTFSGPRYTGPMGAAALFSPLASIVNILVRNPMAPVRIESIDCDVQIEPGRKVAADRNGSARLRHDRARSGPESDRHAEAVQGRARDGRGHDPDPDRLPRGAVARWFSATRPTASAGSSATIPRSSSRIDLDGLVRTIRVQTEPKHTAVYVHVPSPKRGLSVKGQALAEPAGERAGGLRVEAGNADAADPQRHRGRAAGELGRRGHADSPVYRGQGCRAVVIVIVETTGPAPDSMTTRNEMSHSRSALHVRSRSLRTWIALIELAAVSGLVVVGTCQGRNLAAGRAGGLCQGAPRRGRDLRQRPGAARPCAVSAGGDRRRAGLGPGADA